MTWRDDASCIDIPVRGYDPWYPISSGYSDDPDDYRGSYNEARDICRRCPVRVECLEDVLAIEGSTSRHYRYGMRAGLTPEDRAKLARPRRESAFILTPSLDQESA